jgi:hypothetical protein
MRSALLERSVSVIQEDSPRGLFMKGLLMLEGPWTVLGPGVYREL